MVKKKSLLPNAGISQKYTSDEIEFFLSLDLYSEYDIAPQFNNSLLEEIVSWRKLSSNYVENHYFNNEISLAFFNLQENDLM